METRERNRENSAGGYSLIEMLIVTALIFILATIPIALIRRSRDKTFEAEALRSLRMMALAYENYYAQNGHQYPNYRSDGTLGEFIQYKNADEIWGDLIQFSLLPRMYSGYPYNKRDLLARGYQLSIYPADLGADPGADVGNTYAIGMIPYAGSLAHRPLVVVQGMKFFTSYPTALPRRMGGTGLYSLSVYSLAD
jgi:type II secretory pathway pseudopilin PulG